MSDRPPVRLRNWIFDVATYVGVPVVNIVLDRSIWPALALAVGYQVAVLALAWLWRLYRENEIAWRKADDSYQSKLNHPTAQKIAAIIAFMFAFGQSLTLGFALIYGGWP